MALCAPGLPDLATQCALQVETTGGVGQRHPQTRPPTWGALAEGQGTGAAAVPDSGILVPEAVVGGLSAVVAAVVVVVAAVVVATVVGATLGMVGTVVASVVTAGAVAPVLLTAPVAPTVVGGHVGGAGGEM